MPKKKINFCTATLNDLNFVLTLKDVQSCTSKQVDTLRLACQTNLRFLANCVLRPLSKKFLSLKEEVHGRIIDSLIKPNPKKELEEWRETKEAVVLASRGIIKSTIGAALLIQIILCAPDVRILILSGKLDKAESILSSARDPFYNNEVLRYLFPEFAIQKEHIRAGDFITPRRNAALNYRDPTIGVSSFDAVKAGGHYELILLDDATNEQNSNSVDNCKKTTKSYDDTDPLVEPGGYKIFLGTKWIEDDLPAYILAKSDQELRNTGQATASYFVLPAWTLKTTGTPAEVEARNKREKAGSLTPEDVDLTWSEKLSAKFLFPMYRKNRVDFYKQYLLDTSIEQGHSFTPEVLDRQFVARAALRKVAPHDRAIIVLWDMASVFSGRRRKSETDYSCGIIIVFQKSTGKMFVVDAQLAHFSSGDDLCRSVVQMYKTAEMYGPIFDHCVEDADGSRNLGDSITRMAAAMNVDMLPINWRNPEHHAQAKNSRIAVLASAMNEGLVYILNDIPFVDEVRAQFARWTITAVRRRDDAPDAIASAWRHYRGLITPNVIHTAQPSANPTSYWETDKRIEQDDANTDISLLDSTNVSSIQRLYAWMDKQ